MQSILLFRLELHAGPLAQNLPQDAVDLVQIHLFDKRGLRSAGTFSFHELPEVRVIAGEANAPIF